MAKPLLERFWSKVDRSGGPDACWLFTGCRHRDGHGQIKVAGETMYAHRIAIVLGDPPGYQRPGGNIAPRVLPDDLNGLHECDVAPCCNPAHLEIGDQSQNNRECYMRGRHPWAIKRGKALSRQLLLGMESAA